MVYDEVVKCGIERQKNKGKKFQCDDYLAGAMKVQALLVDGWIPASWIFGIMRNANIKEYSKEVK